MEETTVSTELHASDNEKVTAEPKVDPRAFFIPFVKDLRSRVAKSDLERFLWISKSGLFVKDEYASNLAAMFKQWFLDMHQVTLDDEKVQRKLFDEQSPTEKYLVLGSSVVVGFVCPCPTNELRGAGIRLYEGIPLDTAQTLHHTDPIFTKSDKLSIKMSRQGYIIQVPAKKHLFQFDFDTAARLRQFFKASGEQRKYIRVKTLRSFVESFAASLQHAKPLPTNRMMLMPAHYVSGFRGALHLLSTVALVETGDGADQRLIDCFGLEGKGYEQLVREELNQLAQQFDRRRLAGAFITYAKGSFLATYDIVGIRHSFGVSAVFSFLPCIDSYYKEHGKLLGKLKPRGTVRDILPEITALLRDAAPCLPEKVPSKLREQFASMTTILSARGEWFFGIDRNRMIREIAYLPKHQPKPLELKPIQKLPTNS